MKFFKKLQLSSLLLFFITSYSYGFVATALELLEKIYLQSPKLVKTMSKTQFSRHFIEHPYQIKAFNSLNKFDRMKLYIGLSKISESKQLYYLRNFNKLENGDEIMISAIKNNKNLDDVLKSIANNTSKTAKRRITKLEQSLMTSNNASKDYLFGKTVIKRDIFQCSRSNIALMKKGRAPFGHDGNKVNLHHLKQQKKGALVELTQTEHTKHSAVLHRYVKEGSEITDRNSNFQIFRQQYWKARAVGCMARGK